MLCFYLNNNKSFDVQATLGLCVPTMGRKPGSRDCKIRNAKKTKDNPFCVLENSEPHFYPAYPDCSLDHTGQSVLSFASASSYWVSLPCNPVPLKHAPKLQGVHPHLLGFHPEGAGNGAL